MPVQKKNDQSAIKVKEAIPIGVPGLGNHHETVAAIAHTFWERRGRPRDDDWADWLAAEAQAQESGSG